MRLDFGFPLISLRSCWNHIVEDKMRSLILAPSFRWSHGTRIRCARRPQRPLSVTSGTDSSKTPRTPDRIRMVSMTHVPFGAGCFSLPVCCGQGFEFPVHAVANFKLHVDVLYQVTKCQISLLRIQAVAFLSQIAAPGAATCIYRHSAQGGA